MLLIGSFLQNGGEGGIVILLS